MATTIDPDLSTILPSETTLAGPYHLFNSSFTITYLTPHASRNASVLMFATYHTSQPNSETHLGKKYAQSPPSHLHFSQAESFVVLQGRVGTTFGWDCVDKVFTARDGVQIVKPYTVHTFWPVPPESYAETRADAEGDASLLIWAHPKLPGVADGVFPPSMDHLFFHSLLSFVSDIHEGKEKMDLLLIMLMQHESDTAPIMLPTWNILGPLRWWLPWQLQGLLAAVARWQGKSAILERYVGKKDYQKWLHVQRKAKAS